ncbi:toxin-antitoxin system YwqK family antitoxin [Peribacillus loiseleuriae]|uniref:toxin-antitoxin system YwqK family antitoxin n=1 Tax=Peribacillus loiseleuriae TaxID=1679170 RepID=UPI003D00A0C8
MKKFISNNPILSIIIGVLCSIAIGVTILYLVFGNVYEAFLKMIELRGQPAKTAPAMSSLSYVVTWILTTYSIVITAIFSYLVWKINKRSLEVSEELKNIEKNSDIENRKINEKSLGISEGLKQLEENREFESKREKALIVFYDLQRGFTIIRDLYITNILKKEVIALDKAFFSNNWIENVASLRKDLKNEDIHRLYYIYNSLYTIQSYLENEATSEKFIDYIKKITKEFFLDFIPLPLLSELKDYDIEDLISVENYLLMHKLYKLTFNQSDLNITETKVTISNVKHYEIKSGTFYDGEGVLYNSGGYEKLRGHFFNGVFTTGTYYGYLGISKHYNVNYLTASSKREIIKGLLKDYNASSINPIIEGEFRDGSVVDGKTIGFHNNGCVKYRGQVTNGFRNGLGMEFDSEGTLRFEGLYSKGKKVKGKFYSEKGLLTFEGELKNEKPWNGESSNLNINYVKEFKGELREGKPYIGVGKIFKRSVQFSDLNKLIHLEEMNEIWAEQYEEQMGIEENIEEQSRLCNEQFRRDHDDWEDYILADWNNGTFIQREDKESNITVYC